MTNPQCKIFRKSVQWEPRFFLRTDGQRERPDEADGRFCSYFAKALEKEAISK